MDRPIKFNKNGKYNLDFIDWTNEWERIAEVGYTPDKPVTRSPIYGMSKQVFARVMENQFRQMQYDEELVRKEVNGMGELVQRETQKQCTICVQKFVKDEVINLLPCKHIFHSKCLLPWLQKNHECPNCRMDLKQYFKKK